MTDDQGSKKGLEIVRTVADLRQVVSSWHKDGLSVGLVPTMGALHAGHLALIEQSVNAMDRTVATLFVNPKQFGPNEDLDTYPRDEDGDRDKLSVAGTDLLFAPSADEMYARGNSTGVSVAGLGDILEGEFRPGFFDGVATVVAKLSIQAGADTAYFGEKDYQQLLVIRRLARDLDIPTVIEGVAIVRADDGLALSSRNAYLSDEERRIAPALHQTLLGAAEKAGAGEDVAGIEAWAHTQLLDAGFTSVDYLTVRDAETLEAYGALGKDRPARVLAAAKLGSTRLIDNIPAE